MNCSVGSIECQTSIVVRTTFETVSEKTITISQPFISEAKDLATYAGV